jgi:hypothetical protein
MNGNLLSGIANGIVHLVLLNLDRSARVNTHRSTLDRMQCLSFSGSEVGGVVIHCADGASNSGACLCTE